MFFYVALRRAWTKNQGARPNRGQLRVFSQMMLLVMLGNQADTIGESAWEWKRDTPICVLRQQTSQSGETITLSRTPGNEETEIDFTLHPPFRIRDGRFRDAAVKLDSGAEVVADVSAGLDEKDWPDVYVVIQDPAFALQFSKASGLEVSHDKIGTLKVSFRSAVTAVEALQGCEDLKMRQWGIDPVAWRGLKSRPIPVKPVRDRFSKLDYPATELAQGVEGDAVIRLDVGPGGEVQRCGILNVGASPGFEQSACKVLMGARFWPAQDRGDHPVSAPYVFDVRFRIAK